MNLDLYPFTKCIFINDRSNLEVLNLLYEVLSQLDLILIRQMSASETSIKVPYLCCLRPHHEGESLNMVCIQK